MLSTFSGCCEYLGGKPARGLQQPWDLKMFLTRVQEKMADARGIYPGGIGKQISVSLKLQNGIQSKKKKNVQQALATRAYLPTQE